MSGQFSASKKLRIFNKTKGHCAYCGLRLEAACFSIDHLQPRALGGGNENDNLLPVCASCNSSKGKKTLEQFRLFYSAKKVVGKAIFGQEQLEYLLGAGAFPLLGFDCSHLFYFETQGLS